jgi:hypothetical protein
MNIKELFNWREKCFFCQEELVITPVLGNLSAIFAIEGDWIHIQSNSIQFSLNMINGLVKEIEPSVKITADELLKRVSLKLTFECTQCINGSGSFYNYEGRINFFQLNIAKVTMFSESLHLFDKWIFSQYKKFLKNEEYGEISSWKILKADQPGIPGTIAINLPIKTGFIDLSKTTPEKLDNKLKTLIVFS